MLPILLLARWLAVVEDLARAAAQQLLGVAHRTAPLARELQSGSCGGGGRAHRRRR